MARRCAGGSLAIVDYIADDNPDAAEGLKDEIEHKAAKLLDRPQLYRPGHVAGMPKATASW